MTQHTPGPWKLKLIPDRAACPISPYHCGEVFAGLERWRATLVLDKDREQNIANARLIAAAPDMLEALVRLEAQASHVIPLGSAINQARAAIKEATGE